MSIEERILNIAEGPNWYDSRELRAIALDVRKMEERIKQLDDWKESALAVEREWNANAIATMLGGQPGESQREVIQREVPKLLERINLLKEAGDALYELCDPSPIQFDLVDQIPQRLKAWEEAKEDKP